jgi:thiosulfate/3-mercaptopyruvate sulfurtransferase
MEGDFRRNTTVQSYRTQRLAFKLPNCPREGDAMKVFVIRLFMLVVVMFSTLPVWCADNAAAHPEMVVTAQWLSDHLKDPKVVILHVADKRSDYLRGHIPGAKFLLTDDFVEGDDAELPSVDKLKSVFEKLGISDDTRVVIYTTAWYPMAGRAYYTLDYLGHGDKTSLLDGGIEHWMLEKRPISHEEGPAANLGNLTPKVHSEVRAQLAEAKQITAGAEKSKILVDARPPQGYNAGHLAGATPLYWQETLVDPKQDPVFLSPEKLRALFDSRGIKPGEKLVTYCVIGLQASHVYFVAKYLGYDAAMYDGSTHEWSMVNNLPMVKGTSPK